MANTHNFDGQLKDTISWLNINDNTKILVREEILSSNLYQDYVNKYGLHNNLRIILQEYNTSSNYDSTNNYSCEELLTRLVAIYDTLQPRGTESSNNSGLCNQDDLLKLLHEQFDEMSSGMCPQGRTHRLFYVVWSHSFVEPNEIVQSTNLQE